MAEIRTRLTVNGAHPAIVESEITQVLVWLRELNEADLADTVVQLDSESLVNTLLDHVERAERTGRNPRTNEIIKIPARYGVKLQAGSLLKKAVSE